MKIEKMRPFGGNILKCRFNYHLSVVKPTDQEMTAIIKAVCYRGPHAILGHTGKQQGQETGGGGKGMGRSLYCGFLGKAGQGDMFRLAGLGNVSGASGAEEWCLCLVCDAGWSGQRNITSWSLRAR